MSGCAAVTLQMSADSYVLPGCVIQHLANCEQDMEQDKTEKGVRLCPSLLNSAGIITMCVILVL